MKIGTGNQGIFTQFLKNLEWEFEDFANLVSSERVKKLRIWLVFSALFCFQIIIGYLSTYVFHLDKDEKFFVGKRKTQTDSLTTWNVEKVFMIIREHYSYCWVSTGHAKSKETET